MKRGIMEHPKLVALEMHLGVSKAYAVGLVECLVHWSSKYAIQGNPGKWANGVIARGIGWDGDPDELIKALTESRWLDEAESPHRLVIHDIKAHADNHWRQNLTRAGLTWWDGSPARHKSTGRPKKDHADNSTETPQELHGNSTETLPSVACSLKPEACSLKPTTKEETLVNADRVDSPPSVEPEPLPAEKLDKTPYVKITQDWNSLTLTTGLPRISGLSDERKRKAKARWSEPDFREKWPEILGGIRGSPFLCGTDGGWKANFDWLFKNDTNWRGILEGKYSGGGRVDDVQDEVQRLLAQRRQQQQGAAV